MEGQYTRPALWSKHKYGRRDYNRFDHVTSTHMRAGRGSIGKVEVDCRFLFTKSRWGVMGERRDPAGILYLDLDFSQPSDCRLESATVTVTLSEDDGEEGGITKRSVCPVQFTDHYGPKAVRGPESLVQTRKVKNRTPEVQVLGYGAGGLGQNKEKVVQTRGRWDFSGYISSTKDSIWYNKLRWELKENSLEWQPTHNNLFHTAFAIQHNATRFYMTVHVSGKLARLSDRIKGRLKFGENGGKDQEIVTKIEWAEGYSCPSRLDEMAQYLHEAMGMANMTKVPVEMPSALPASYHPAVANSSEASAVVATPTAMAPALQHSPLLLLPGLQQTEPWRHGQYRQPNRGPWLAPASLRASVVDEGSSAMGDSTEHLPVPAPLLTTSPESPPAEAEAKVGVEEEVKLGVEEEVKVKAEEEVKFGVEEEVKVGVEEEVEAGVEEEIEAGVEEEAEVGAEEGSDTSSSSLTLVNSAAGTTTEGGGEEPPANEADADADTWQDDSGGEEEGQESGSRGVKAGTASGSQRGTEMEGSGTWWVVAIAMRPQWLRTVGVFLVVWLTAMVGRLLETRRTEGGSETTRKPKEGRRRASTCPDDDSWESSPTKIKLDYARRGRLRGRRGRRASLRELEGGGRARRKSVL